MNNKSIWIKDINLKTNNDNNEKDIETDILIIGGGITGITTAYYLNNTKKKICLIDKSYIGFGVTSCSTGKLTFLQSDMLEKIENIHGTKKAKKYYEATKDAIKNVEEIITTNNINCDFKKVPSYLYITEEKEQNSFDKTLKFLDKVKQKYEYINDNIFPFKQIKCIKVTDTAIFNPVKYVRELYKLCTNINFYENTRAINVVKCNKKYLVKTNKNTITAKKIVIATHYPFFITPGLIPFKTHLERSYIAAFKNKEINDASGINLKKPIISIRSQKDDYLLYASCSHKMTNEINYEERYNELIKDIKNKFNTTIDYIWMTHDITSNDILPIIGKIDTNLLIATAFNKWGMTNGSIAGKILSDIILNKKNKYINLFSPNRNMTIGKIKNFITDSTNLIKLYTKTTLVKNHDFYKSNVYVKYINDELCGIYIDENNKKHVVKNKCPHMKCNLIFNNFDKTWDCPCHGSRFDIDGNVLQGPSTYNIKIE